MQLQSWSSAVCQTCALGQAPCLTNPYTLERHLQVNRKSMLARVSKILPKDRRKTGASSLPLDVTASGHARTSSALPDVLAPVDTTSGGIDALAEGAALTSMGATISGTESSHQQLRGKPSAVIQGFVTDNSIDLLVVPVPPPSTFKKLDPRNMRGVRAVLALP
jgi:hypothetical protein